MKKQAWPLYLFILLILIACQKETPSKKSGSNKSSKGLPARAIVLESQPIEEYYIATGNIDAYEQVQIASEVSGRVEQILFKEGQNVKRGRTLIKLDDDLLQNDLSSLKVQKELAEKQAKRALKLFEAEAISQEELDEITFALRKLEEDIKKVETQIDKTQIRAPFSGVLGFRNISPGTYISQGQEIVSMVDLHAFKLNFDLPEKYAGFVKIGDSIEIQLQNQSMQASINQISPLVNPASRTFQVRAIIPNKGLDIVAGAFAEIRVPIYKNDHSLLIPTEAITQKLSGEEVFILKQGKAQPIAVQSGIRKSDRIEISSGLSAGDTVIISGLLSIQKGTPVNAEIVKLN